MGINISGTSSHDYYWDAHFTEEKNSKKRVYDIITNELVSGNSYFRLYRFPGYSAQISVSYRGMPETMELYHFVEGFWMYTDKKGGIN